MKTNIIVLSLCTVTACPVLQVEAQQSKKQNQAKTSVPARGKSERNAKPPADALSAQQAIAFAARVASVLRSTADDAKRWENAAAAAKVQAQVADLIWEDDEHAARGFLVAAWETTGKVEAESREKSEFRNHSPRNNAQGEVMSVARKRAPELAEKWLAQMAEETEAERDSGKRGVFDDRTARSTVLLQMAMQAVEQNPTAATELAIESLRDGISFGLQNVLINLQAKDFQLAQRVFRAALARLQTVGTADPNELLILHSYLYSPGQIRAANTSDDQGRFQLAVTANRPRIDAAANLNPALATEFIRVAAALLINAPPPVASADPQTTARAQSSVIATLLPKIAQVSPEQAAMLQAKLAQANVDARFSASPSRPEPAPRTGESKDDYLERRIDEMEEAAKKEPSGLSRDIAFAKAALATTVERYERGLSLAGSIEDETLQIEITNWLLYRAALNFIKASNFNDAYALFKRSTSPTQKAAASVAGAQKYLQQKDSASTNSARQWLDDAMKFLKAAGTEEDAVRVGLGAVAAYGGFDKWAALDALGTVVKLLNESDVTTVDGDKAPEARRFSGLTVPNFTHGTSGFGLQAAVEAFDAEQFENVLTTLSEIKRPEVRGSAVVLLSRKHLQQSKSRRQRLTASQ